MQPAGGTILRAFDAEVTARRIRIRRGKMESWANRNASILTFVGLGAVGIGLRLLYDLLLRESVIHSLSDAFIVAAILGVSVDWFLKRALIKDVGSIFIGWALPQQLREHIREVSEIALVRYNRLLHYKVTRTDSELFLDVIDSWEIYNFGTSRRKYTSLQAIDLHERPDVNMIRCTQTFGGKTVHWDAEKLNSDKRTKEEGDAIHWQIKPVILKSQQADDPHKKAGCHIEWRYRLRVPVYSSTNIYFPLATVGVTVSVDCPKEIDFTCDQSESTLHAPGSNRWQHDRLFAPGQVLHLKWKPTADATQHQGNE
jgi:hypothetical protein